MKKVYISLVIAALSVAKPNAFAADCESNDLMEKASTAFIPLFQANPDLTGSSVMPFRGKVVKNDCDGKAKNCNIHFAVNDIYFDQLSVFNDTFNLSSPVTKNIIVTALGDSKIPDNLPLGSEWLVVAYSYGSRDGDGRGTNYNCGEWMGEIKDEIIFYNEGKSKISYISAKEKILKPVTDAGDIGIENLRVIFRSMANR